MRHSQHANDPLLHAWIICEDNGLVESGHCTCMAGLGEVCSHVGAILFYVQAVHQVRGKETCTHASTMFIDSATEYQGYSICQSQRFNFHQAQSITSLF